MRSLLAEGAACPCAWAEQVCRKLLSAEASLWTSAAVEGVPPPNNAAERALRHGVIRRETSYGTDDERGSRFVERMLIRVATCHQRGRDVFGFLTASSAPVSTAPPRTRCSPEWSPPIDAHGPRRP